MILILSVLYICLSIFLAAGLCRCRQRSPKEEFLPQVSILVVARNEEKVVEECLLALTRQDYPAEKIEILFVDDESSDRTLDLAERLQPKNPQMKIFDSSGPYLWKSQKKAGLELARSRARGEILLLTDADCLPATGWAKSMVAEMEKQTGLVVGPSPLQAGVNRLWGGFLKIDSLFAALFSAGGIGWGIATTCTGRNLAVRAEALEKIGGYAALPDTLSGDDDFLLQKMTESKKWQVKYNLSAGAVVPARGPSNFRELLAQKRRHISAAASFNRPAQIIFFVYHAANYGCWLLFIMSPFWGPGLAIPILAKLILDSILLKIFANKVAVRFSSVSFLMWQILLPVYNLLAAPVSFLGKVEWDKSVRTKA